MGLKEKLLNQCRKPKGVFGKLVVKRMNKEHFNMAEWGISHITINPKDVILDIGCGGGLNVYSFAHIIKEGKVYGIDYSKVSVKLSKKLNKKFIESGLVEIKYASVSSLPFPENSFDLITAFETYYFWPDLINDLKGILNLLKPGGTLLLTNEVFKCKNKNLLERNEKWAKLGKFIIHTPQEFQELLEKVGFSEITIDTEENRSYIVSIGKKDFRQYN